MHRTLSRLDALKLTALVVTVLAAGAPAAGGATAKYGAGNPNTPLDEFFPTPYATQRYTYFEQLPPFDPSTSLETDEMRIIFMGSTFPMVHRAQAEMSVFVEVGWVANEHGGGRPLDSFVFDLGCGAAANYTSAGIDFARMSKIFINHQHADHVSDLIQVYSFGDGGSRKFPLYVWGNNNTFLPNPGQSPAVTTSIPVQGYATSPAHYNDGVSNMCYHLREALRWQTESQAFQSSAYTTYPTPAEIQAAWGLPVLPVPVSDDPYQDANALIPIELDWTKSGQVPGDNVAYHNQGTGARITHYPVIHSRKGSMGHKLQWTPPGSTKPLTMVYSSDTKPETNSIWQAINVDSTGKTNGVDVFIHEMALAPEAMVVVGTGLSEPLTNTFPGPVVARAWSNQVSRVWLVEESSHTPQGAFGYMLSQINPRPRLAVATHFPTTDQTVACALRSVQAHCPDITKAGDALVWSFDLMVLRVFPDRILQHRAVPNDFAFSTPASVSYDTVEMYAPKYHTETGEWDPWIQLDQSTQIQPTGAPDGQYHYRNDGY